MKQKQCILLLLAIIYCNIGFSQLDSNTFICDYLNETQPENEPEIFAKGIISVDNKNTHALMFSPDGKMVIFSRYPDKESYIMYHSNDSWTKPEKAPFKGKEISFSKDGKMIFYYDNGDIYYVEYHCENFSKPHKLDSTINTKDTTEYFPSITYNGNLYFSRNGKWDKGKIMFSEYKKGKFQYPIDLNQELNNGGALHSYVAKDESYILFNSPRIGSYTKLDIWISFRMGDSLWTKPVNLGKKINNSADAILCPTVSPDGKYLFFTKLYFEQDWKDNTGYVYWVSTKIIEELKEKVLNSN